MEEFVKQVNFYLSPRDIFLKYYAFDFGFIYH